MGAFWVRPAIWGARRPSKITGRPVCRRIGAVEEGRRLMADENLQTMRLRRAAKKRDIEVNRLMTQIVATVLDHDIIDAVLNDV